MAIKPVARSATAVHVAAALRPGTAGTGRSSCSACDTAPMVRDRNAGSTIVYSTDRGRLCPSCQQPVAACACARTPQVSPPPGDGVVRVSRETKGRAGKGVTTVSGLGLDEAALAKLARELKARCATGGTVRDGVVELQGEHRDALVQELTRRGYRVKRAGG